MKIYIAGGVNGNLGKWFWDDMKLYLASNDGYVIKSKTYLQNMSDDFLKRLNILESFYYIKEWQIPLIKKFNSFMLDSGAFTFMQNKKSGTDYDKYTYKYCEFINKNKIKLFFEMDIDSVVGIKKVEQLRKIIEKETGKQCIPVWHRSRGKQYFEKMCKEYSYIGIGGFVSKEIRGNQYGIINYLCDFAHKHNCKIHGLGFTKQNLTEYKFDSVDSTAWTYGNRGKFIYEFNGKDMIKHSMNHQSNRLKPRETAIHNFNEWIKWGEYLAVKKNNLIYYAGTYSRQHLYGNKK